MIGNHVIHLMIVDPVIMYAALVDVIKPQNWNTYLYVQMIKSL
ncbi:hypothetical protein LX74_03747 [Elizabethkingia miricola]|uniref:Uncharacterized protein n=1 Tax=Elizabethkingia miricola TaxID=172045 RepID=A0ABY3NB82_ELIMR|nr:hypothetical protein LX74_03747 [Elizabethkingia miricola]